ncbi:hypothetical protein SAMN03159335_07871 [Burkholderia cepacia]|uniref:DUF6573 family protein n=1 Tax=Burkholderia cepacia TaxID=292 RepID=UPI0008CFDA3F|nr:DUF6573 family protein [Burkholderia cepacia]SEU48024.1 hypothetical protein SAMN03159335_07871 [Burkholderia cepacia]HDR9280230.1 hypothetical protein [Burkholderia vietnamiensis]
MRHPEQHLDSVFGEPIHVYTRAQAIENGALIDVSQVAHEAGFRLPVALTTAVWADCVAWDDTDSQRQLAQDEAGRLWDVIWMACLAARRARESQRVAFQVYRVPRGGPGIRARLTTLHMCIGPGDNAAPVITILMPNED